MVTCLRGHTGLVKGLTWDPVGKYIASQADDHSLKVWRTVDWQLEANITKPFNEVQNDSDPIHICLVIRILNTYLFFPQCGGTTHVLRLSWSPDGQYLVSAHAMNNSGPTAQIVERDGWKTNMDFVGHRKAVTVVVSNSRSHIHPLECDKCPNFTCMCFSSPPTNPLEIQPKDLQEEAEERQLSEAQLSVLLLRRRQQRPIALRLGG